MPENNWPPPVDPHPSLTRGIQQAAEGKLVDRGSFQKYAKRGIFREGSKVTGIIFLLLACLTIGAALWLISTDEPAKQLPASDFNQVALEADMVALGIDPRDTEFIDQVRILCTEDPQKLADFLISSTAQDGYAEMVTLLADTCPVQVAKTNIIISNTHTVPT